MKNEERENERGKMETANMCVRASWIRVEGSSANSTGLKMMMRK